MNNYLNDLTNEIIANCKNPAPIAGAIRQADLPRPEMTPEMLVQLLTPVAHLDYGY